MPAPRTVYRGGSRFYVHPDRGREFPGVTSVIDAGIAKQRFLIPWAARMTAELAVDTLETPDARRFFAAMVERDRSGAVDYLKGASARYTKARGTLGSKAHDVFERMLRGEDVQYVHPDIEEHTEHFRAFLAEVNPELVRAEEVIWSDTHRYAGSYDAIVNVWLKADGTPDPTRKAGTRRTLIVDWKTGKDLHAEVGIQLAAYAHGDVTIDADGAEHEVPELDGAAALHVTDKGWSFHPIRGGLLLHFETFLLLRDLFEWTRESAPGVIGRPIAGSGRLVTGTERRA